MRKHFMMSATLAFVLMTGESAMAQADNTSDTAGDQGASNQADATPEGTTRQTEMPPMRLIKAMLLDLQESSAAGVPTERGNAVFATGERIAIYTKFANVGRTNPGAIEGMMDLTAELQVLDGTGQVIIEQAVPSQGLETVQYPYEGPIPAAYFESFKLTLLALPSPGIYTIALTFKDETRPELQTQPVVVVLTVTII